MCRKAEYRQFSQPAHCCLLRGPEGQVGQLQNCQARGSILESVNTSDQAITMGMRFSEISMFQASIPAAGICHLLTQLR